MMGMIAVIVVRVFTFPGEGAISYEQAVATMQNVAIRWNTAFPRNRMVYTLTEKNIHIIGIQDLEARYKTFDIQYDMFNCSHKAVCLFINPPIIMSGKYASGGLAWKNSLYRSDRPKPIAAIWTNYKNDIGLSAAMALHEIGHTVGMRHHHTASIMSGEFHKHRDFAADLEFHDRSKLEFRRYMRRHGHNRENYRYSRRVRQHSIKGHNQQP